jgi:integrase
MCSPEQHVTEGKKAVKFTKGAIAALVLPAGKSDHIEWDPDLPNFGIRLRPGGSKTWTIYYRVGAKQRRESLGDVRKLDLDAARKIAKQLFAQVELGHDPRAARDKARAEAAISKLTLAVGAKRYLEFKRPLLRPATYEATERYFSNHWAPLLDRPIEVIRRQDVASVLQTIAKEHGRTSARVARASLSGLLSWCMREGLIENNVVVGTNNPAQGLPSRERVLGDNEPKSVWDCCLADDAGAIIKLLTLTGCRRDEIAALRWSEIALDNAVLNISGERTKNRKMHVVPLSAPALTILHSIERHGGLCVFGKPHRGFTSWSAAKVKIDARIAASGTRLEPWRLHDLRRTCRSGLGRLAVPPHIAELVIGHTRKGLEATYDKYHYGAEIRAALDRWAAHVLSIVEDRQSKIVPLQRA